MTAFTFGHFLRAAGARIAGGGVSVDKPFQPSTDTRSLDPGEVFVCLRGPNFDGHDFIADAVARGCCAVVVDDPSKMPASWPVPAVIVNDTKAAYVRGAAAARQLNQTRVIAVTGSSGKTTTKAMLAQLLGRVRTTLATPQNENNELGVAKICYRLHDGVQAAVIEFGARKPGDIVELVDIARPEVAVLTNVGEAHLAYFASHEALAREKFSIFSGNARPVLSAGDEWSRTLAAERGVASDALWARMTGDDAAPGLALEAGTPADGRVPVSFGSSHAYARWTLVGDHHLRDALLAGCAALAIGVSFEDVVAGFALLRLPEGRFERHTLPSGATLIYDAYNANPSSMISSLDAFAQLEARRRIAVLGSMAELGADAAQHHERVGAAARQRADLLFAGGEFGASLAAGALRAGMAPEQVVIFSDNEQASAALRDLVRAGDAVLLKGSRVQRMEEILHALERAQAQAS